MTPRCDGCRYFVMKPEATIPGVSREWLASRYGWTPWVGGREDRDALVIGLCRRYPTLVDKAPADWCGEYVGKEGA